jgi:hypothetical protein
MGKEKRPPTEAASFHLQMRCHVASWHIASLAAVQRYVRLGEHRKWSPQGQADAIDDPNRKPRLLVMAVISPRSNGWPQENQPRCVKKNIPRDLFVP